MTGASLLVLAWLMVSGESAHADDEASPPRYATVVTATRVPRPLPDVASSVTVITKPEIERTPGLSADDLVRLSPSANAFRRTSSLTADPSAQGLNLRGLGPSGVSRALVLADGIPANDPFGGWTYWRALPRLGLGSVEIVPGGTSALYGDQALGGTVNFISRAFTDVAEADAAFGSLNTWLAGAYVAGTSGANASSFEFRSLGSDGYVPVAADARGSIDRPAHSHSETFIAALRRDISDAWRATLRLSAFDEDQNGGTAFTSAHVKRATASVSLVATLARGGSLAVSGFGNVGEFNQTRARVAADRNSETLAATQRVPNEAAGASVVWTSAPLSAAGTHTLVAGVDARAVAGEAIEQLIARSPTGLVERRSGGQQYMSGVFAQELYAPVHAVELSAGARVDVWNNVDGHTDTATANGAATQQRFDDRQQTAFNPRFGVLVRPSTSTRLRLTAYRAFRAPTLNELYRPFQVGTVLTAANEALTAERLSGADAGAEWLGHYAALRVCGFWNVLYDPIVNATLANVGEDGSMRRRENLGRVRVAGIEAAGDARVGRYVWLSAAYTLVDSRVKEAPQEDLVNKRLPQDPVHRTRFTATVLHPSGWQLGVSCRLQSRQFEDDKNLLSMPGYALLDVTAAAPLAKSLFAFATVENAINQRYLVGRAGVDTIGAPLVAMVGLRLRMQSGVKRP